MTPDIIFQDESLMVINKPSGWITNDATTTTNQPTVQDWVRRNFQFQINNFQFRNGIVHRLDKETSGILLIAKTENAFYELQRQFKERIVEKSYLALVHGRVERDKSRVLRGGADNFDGIINAPVGRLPWRRDRFGVLPGGRDAVTAYKVLSRYTIYNMPYTLVEFRPQTGRTHQIRIHAKHIGYPLVSDDFYAGRKTARNDRKWCSRLFLHASTIKFLHPVTKKEVEFKADLPKDLQNVLSASVTLAG